MVKNYLLSIILFFIFSNSHAQVEHVAVRKNLSIFPKLADKQYGNITYYEICDSLGLVTLDSLQITSFKLQYISEKGETLTMVLGNNIPDSICVTLGMFGINTPIFITDILAESSTGDTYLLPSLNFYIAEDDE